MRCRAVVTGGQSGFLVRSSVTTSPVHIPCILAQPARRAQRPSNAFSSRNNQSFGRMLTVIQEPRPTKIGGSSPALLTCQLLTNSCKKLDSPSTGARLVHKSLLTSHLSLLTPLPSWHVFRLLARYGLRSTSGGRLQYGRRWEHQRCSPR